MIPKFDKRAICITSDYKLGALISSYFHEPNTYFIVFDFLDIDKPKEGLVFEIVSGRAKIVITNKIKMVNPDYIIFAGLNDYAKSFFNEIPKEKIISIEGADDLSQKMKIFKTSFSGEIVCSQHNLNQGLLNAKKEKKKLVIKKGASKLKTSYHNKEGLIVIEKGNSINNLAAVNYSFSLNADLVVVQKVENQELEKLKKDLKIWGKTKSKESFQSINRKIKRRVKKIKIENYDYATFFTKGLPYCFGLKNIIPISHIFNPGADHILFDNIFIENNKKTFGSSLVFSPEEFDIEETAELVELFKNKNLYTKELIKNDATVQNFSKYTEHYPYDVMHICSHGGELDGMYVTQKFTDRTGKQHQVEYYEVATFACCEDEFDDKGQPKIEVVSMFIFQKLDGYKWMSPELKKCAYSEYVFQDMNNAIGNEKYDRNKVVRVKANYEIPTSRSVKCINGYHQAQFHYLAGQSSPFVFNNSCNSWYEIAHYFIGIGARAYIGTLWPINTVVASNAAVDFYNNVFSGCSFSQAISKVNQNIDDENYKDIYIFWGLHFSSISRPEVMDESHMIGELRAHFFGVARKIFESDKEEIIKNSQRIAKFIYGVLKNEFSYDLSKKVKEWKKYKKVEMDTEDKDDDKISERSFLIKK